MSGAVGRRPDLLLLVPLTIECAAVAGVPGARVARIGMGPRRAVAAAQRARRTAAAAVGVTGFCAGLHDDLRPGDVVVATTLTVDGDGSAPVRCSSGPLVAALRARGIGRVHTGPMASSPRIVHGADRARLAREGAIAADMESAWLAPGGGRPFAVLRVVLDTPLTRLSRPAAAVRGLIRAHRSLRRAAPALLDWARAAGDRRILLASPRSFCAGAQRAIETVTRALELSGTPVYVRKQIVHNTHVVEELQRRGARFVDSLDEVPPDSLVVFSAHGVTPAVRQKAAARGLRVIDATCPLVTKVHKEARRFAAEDRRIILIGHPGHDEVEGTIGEAPESITVVESAAEADDLEPTDEPVAFLTQTTLAVDEVEAVVERLRRRFPRLVGPRSEDICYATSNRQEAVRAIARDSDLVLVIGSPNSSNSCRLVEIAEREGCPARLIDDETDLDPACLTGRRRIGVTAGASAPQELVDRVVDALAGLGRIEVEERSVRSERLHFTLPRDLRDIAGPGDRVRPPATVPGTAAAHHSERTD